MRSREWPQMEEKRPESWGTPMHLGWEHKEKPAKEGEKLWP